MPHTDIGNSRRNTARLAAGESISHMRKGEDGGSVNRNARTAGATANLELRRAVLPATPSVVLKAETSLSNITPPIQ